MRTVLALTLILLTVSLVPPAEAQTGDWSQTWDFTVNDGGWVARVASGWGSSYVTSTGWRNVSTTSNSIALAIPSGTAVTYARMEFSGGQTDGGVKGFAHATVSSCGVSGSSWFSVTGNSSPIQGSVSATAPANGCLIASRNGPAQSTITSVTIWGNGTNPWAPAETATPTPSPTPTATYTPSITPTPDVVTPAVTPTLTPTFTPSPTRTLTPTITYTPSWTPNPSATPNDTATPTFTPTVTFTPTPTWTPAPPTQTIVPLATWTLPAPGEPMFAFPTLQFVTSEPPPEMMMMMMSEEGEDEQSVEYSQFCTLQIDPLAVDAPGLTALNIPNSYRLLGCFIQYGVQFWGYVVLNFYNALMATYAILVIWLTFAGIRRLIRKIESLRKVDA
jgi:hypothetical protein